LSDEAKDIHSPSDEKTEWLMTLLRTHPMREVREEFYQKLKNQEIKLIWLDCHGTVNCGDAAFDVVEDSVGLLPVLYITEKFRQNSDKTYASLVLFHEFVHYQQFLSNPTSFGRGCEMIWESEKEASILECVLALKLGVANEYVLCVAPDEPAFNGQLVQLLNATHSIAQKCRSTWSNLATHSS
jgi:hypothetical protein